ncbi:MAG: serine hydrolase [Proteobacteria bacterium]|nr:serine hydrolase [Pseudomonadota bacterium]
MGRRTASGGLAALLVSARAVAQTPAPVDPTAAGFSPQRLARIEAWFKARIASGAMPGAAVAIWHDGKPAYLKPVGTQDRAKKVPMRYDSIFWIASMTKTVTSVAAMMLVEDGKLQLDAPVARYLPELADMKVDGAPPKRPMQVIDLLRHTAGLTYPEEGNTPEHRRYDGAFFRRDHTLAEFVTSLADKPLLYQPGEVWEYSWGVDVLGRVIEVASGQSLDVFFRKRLFDPLGMVDTGFAVPPEKLARVVDPAPAAGRWPLWDITKPAKLFAGGAGLASTAPDFLRFSRMLLNGGELDGKRYLTTTTVKRMTTDQLAPGTPFKGEVGKWVGPKWGTSWGLGFEVRTNPDYSLRPGAVGSFGWSGIWGTYFWIDPTARLAVVMLIQVDPSAIGRDRDAVRHLTYAALSVMQPPEPAAAPPPRERRHLERFIGTYDFGASLSVHDKRGAFPGSSFTGVGLEIEVVKGVVVVRTPIPGGPALRAGVRTDDVVAAVDGRTLQDRDLDSVLAAMRGSPGTKVTLTIRRGDLTFDVQVTRAPIQIAGARVEVTVANDELVVTAVGLWPVFDFEKGKPTVVKCIADAAFRNPGGEGGRLTFTGAGVPRPTDGGEPLAKATGVLLNPGPEQIEGRKVD